MKTITEIIDRDLKIYYNNLYATGKTPAINLNRDIKLGLFLMIWGVFGVMVFCALALVGGI